MRLVYAGSYQQYQDWCRENDAREGLDSRYVMSIEDTMGYPRDTEVVYYGTYHERPDWTTIGPMLEARFRSPAPPSEGADDV